MAATTGDVIRDRVSSVVASSPFSFIEARTPFDFDSQPSGEIDQVFRIESEGAVIIGGFNYTEERSDLLTIWLARKHNGDSPAMYRTLVTDVSSLRAAVIRDGLVQSGDYCVPDEGAGFSVAHDAGREFAVLRLTLPVNYESQT